MANPTISQTVGTAYVSNYLCSNNVALGVMYGQRLQPQQPAAIYLERKALDWMYGQNPNYSSLQFVANHVWQILYKNGQAQYIYNNNSGSSVVPVTPPVVAKVYPIEWIVIDSGVPINTGGSTLLLDGTNGNQDWRGYNITFNRGNVLQDQIDTGGSYCTWDTITGLFTCYGPANVGDEFSLRPAIGSGIPSTSPALPYTPYVVTSPSGFISFNAGNLVAYLVIKSTINQSGISIGKTAGSDEWMSGGSFVANVSQSVTIGLPIDTTPTLIYFSGLTGNLTVNVYPNQI